MKKVKPHWTKNLTEAGSPITRLGNAQENLRRKINELREQIKGMEVEYFEEEQRIESIVINPDPDKGWTPEEVASAKRGEKV